MPPNPDPDSTPEPMRVLVVDDDAMTRKIIEREVVRLGHECRVAEDGRQAWELFRESAADIVVSDWRMPRLDGLELCRRIRDHPKETYTYFILLTVVEGEENLRASMDAGVDDFISKPLDPVELEVRFRVASRITKLHHNVRAAEDRINELEEQTRARIAYADMIGKSAPIQEVYRRIRLASRSEATVLLFGESGTGKELAARAIHAQGPRAARPFVAVNCGAIPETVLESELFGHAKGAYTGAIRDRKGLFEIAHGGTLFLDEIGDVTPHIQLRLLRAIEEREVRRVGDEQTTRVDVRFLAATNKNLSRLVAEGSFREDLFYRIKVFQIDLPALRERREDLPLLMEHFRAAFGESSGKETAGFDPDGIRAMMDYPWPGNVRELRNAIEHAFVVVAPGEALTRDHLPPEIRQSPRSGVEKTRRPGKRDPEEVAREIFEALGKTGGNRSRAARLLGISRVALWNRIRRLGLEDQVPPPPTGVKRDDR